jgi:putative transposase
MQLGHKIRLYPTKKQAIQLARFAGASRFAWNESLAFCKSEYEKTGKLPSELECRHHLVELRNTTHPWLNDIPEAVTKRAITELHKAYKQAFHNAKHKKVVSKKRDKQGHTINPYGFPQFKKRGKCKTAFYQRTDTFHMTDRRHVKITGIKKPVRVKYGRIPEHVVNTHITYECGHWYLSYAYEVEPMSDGSDNDGVIGIDLGLKDMAVCSDGTVYPNPNKDEHAVRMQNRIRFLQRRLSKKYEANRKGKKYVKTSNIIKLEKKLAKLQRDLANYRNNARHQMTHDIAVSRPKIVAIEDLNVKGMLSNRKMAKAVGKVGFFEVRRQLAYKSELYGYELVVVGRYYPSTRTCSCCGELSGPRGFDGLRVREWDCPSCGAHHHRDMNAALNLVAYVEGSSGPVCQSKSLGSPTPTGVVTAKQGTMKQASEQMALAI